MKIIHKIKNLPIKGILSALLVAALFVVSLPAPIALSAANPTPIATRIFDGIDTKDAPQSPATSGMKITGKIPVAQTTSSQLNAELEERWTAQRNAFIQNHMAGALSMNSSVERFVSGQYVSVAFIKEAVSLSTTATISTTVIDTITGNIITLTDFNVNILQLINNHINNQIAARPHSFSNFSGIDANHPFYLDGDRLVIPFGSGELISNERGIHRIEFSINNIEDEQFSSNHFRVLEPSQYSTIMIRLSDVMERFGYTVIWEGETRTVNIYENDELVSSMAIGENAYYYRDSTVRELEVAPILYNNLTYVPLSFFNELVSMPTTVSSDGVTVSRYRSTNGISARAVYNGFLAE